MKPIIYTHQNPLLEDIQKLKQDPPSYYEGFIYLWKCIPEDMFYVGSHKGLSHDEYRGSGSRFKRVFEYYGLTQFERVIVEYVEDAKQIKVKEQLWMNKFRAKHSSRFYNTNNVVASMAI